MPTPTKGRRMGGSSAHQKHMLSNLATALFEHGKITTTEARARRLRPFAERLITMARKDDLHARRQVVRQIADRDVVKKLFSTLGPRFATRPGGYTRTMRLGPRQGDGAEMALVELVGSEGLFKKQREERLAKKDRRDAAKKKREDEQTPPPEATGESNPPPAARA